MWLPLTTVGAIVAGMAIFGFYDRAKYLAAHPEEDSRVSKKSK